MEGSVSRIDLHGSTKLMLAPAALLTLIMSSPLLLDDWPTFLGPRQNGTSAESGILTDWSEGKLKTLWQLPVGQGYSIGSVADDRYVHFDRDDQGRARVRCVSAETGKPIWQFAYPSAYEDLYGYDSGPRTSPLIDDGNVYTLGVEGMLHCLSLKDGSVLWKADTSQQFGVVQNFFGVGSSPVVSGNLLLVMVGGSTEATRNVPAGRLDRIKPDGSAIVAFDKQTGSVKYRLGNDHASYCSMLVTDQLTAYQDRRVGLAWCRETLIGFDVENGGQLFEFAWRARMFESVNASTPVIVDGQIFLSECYGPGGVLLGFDSSKQPVVVWSDQDRRNKSMATHWNTPILHEGYLYGSSGRHTGQATLQCIEASTGNVQWSIPGLGRCSLTLVDHHLVVLAEYGRLFLIKANPDRFQLVSELPKEAGDGGIGLVYPCWSAPVISDGRMYVRGKKNVVCLKLID